MLHSLHRYLGLLLLVPLLTWTVTGAVFILQPGYRSAFELIEITTYPLQTPVRVRSQPEWHELRVLRTVLGKHLLVRNLEGQWQQLHPVSLQPRPMPTTDQLQQLLDDALRHDPGRYGTVIALEKIEPPAAPNTDSAPLAEPQTERLPVSAPREVRALTSTGITLMLDWPSLNLRQSGPDTELINRLYSLHYLQWTPNAALNRSLAILALIGLLVLSIVGIRLFVVASNRERETETDEDSRE